MSCMLYLMKFDIFDACGVIVDSDVLFLPLFLVVSAQIENLLRDLNLESPGKEENLTCIFASIYVNWNHANTYNAPTNNRKL